jgi:hypothetical protein
MVTKLQKVAIKVATVIIRKLHCSKKLQKNNLEINRKIDYIIVIRKTLH